MIRNVFVFALLCISISIYSQNKISGVLNNKKGTPLIGANVILEELNTGAISDVTGKYEILNVQPGTYTIQISYIGYKDIRQEINVYADIELNFVIEEQVISGEEIIVRSTRAGVNTPTTYTEVKKEAISLQNLGQDMPYLLGMEPSLVTTSDGGAGVGYTGMWIRGSNIQRINVTVNGVPINDPESHGVFWVNMPDFASSVESAQVQRGVGTSTNGGGAFGATINLETNTVEEKAFGEINSSFGSFNTFKNNARFGTGLIKGKWAFEGRLSKIKSDGYIDRASSDLSSYFVQGGYYTDRTTVKAVVFSGKEKTYQAWYGVDQWTIDNYGRTFNWAGVIFNEDGSMRYYDDQTDNYQQDHYQLHWTQKITDKLSFNSAVHYTYGRGYYEEYKQSEDLEDYPIGTQLFGYDSVMSGSGYDYFYHDTIATADLIVRRWLDNHFYGGTFAFNYTGNNILLTVGGAANKYANAKHYGEIIWAQYTGNTNIRDKYYDNESDKTDINLYAKADYRVLEQMGLFADLQFRNIIYKAEGIDKGGDVINIDEKYKFFNPKVGLTYDVAGIGKIYASIAIANREPIRTDFLDAPGENPEAEQLVDYELGIRNRNNKAYYSFNFYYMKYKNQLVLTGELNDVGSPIRANVGESFRSGVELDGGQQLTGWFRYRANAALSTSATDFNEITDSVTIVHKDVAVSFSPKVVAGLELTFTPVKNLDVTAISKYVSKQYLNLTENDALSLDAYGAVNLRASYKVQPEFMREILFTVMVNNLFNAEYASNGYVYGTVPYYYPQAGVNYLAGLTLKF